MSEIKVSQLNPADPVSASDLLMLIQGMPDTPANRQLTIEDFFAALGIDINLVGSVELTIGDTDLLFVVDSKNANRGVGIGLDIGDSIPAGVKLYVKGSMRVGGAGIAGIVQLSQQTIAFPESNEANLSSSYAVTKLTSTSATLNTLYLPSPSASIVSTVTVILASKGGSGNTLISPQAGGDFAGNVTGILLSAEGDTVTLMQSGSKWYIVSKSLGTIINTIV
jgi:hypothetical protein